MRWLLPDGIFDQMKRRDAMSPAICTLVLFLILSIGRYGCVNQVENI